MNNNQKVDLVHKFKVMPRNKKQLILKQKQMIFMIIPLMNKIVN